MQTILEKIQSKPSIALQFMVDGLENTKNQSNSVVDMGTYGSANNNICFKCAATVTIESMFNHVFNPEEIITIGRRVNSLSNDDGFFYIEYSLFEDVMDCARCGLLEKLFEFCKEVYTNKLNAKFEYRFRLSSDNWEKELPKVKKVIKELQEQGY